ncbi:hypothetical protein ABT404_47955 [Streptomyces hyaluromycini]|uniref:Uncharacterized protein n=1 Tax=Streptomyces hyaluromycini TaxID=1377993 RepID=A0ABV1XDK1_9ACTN
MLRTEVVRAAAVEVLAALSFLPVSALPVGVWLGLLYLLVYVVNVAGQFFNPARFAVLSEVVGGDVDRTRAAGGATALLRGAAVGPAAQRPVLCLLPGRAPLAAAARPPAPAHRRTP